MSLNIQMPENTVMRPQITVFGVGGAGGNATNNMIKENLEGVNFVVANTDAQALENSVCKRRIQLGQGLTKGLGAGALPDVGRRAAEEAINEINEHLEGSNMVFITAGMGGGTGTGAAPVIARAAREKGILTVGVVTKPFHFEGPRRMRMAEEGLDELQKNVDTLIIIPNQNLFRIANERTTFAEAFTMADDVLHSGVRGVTDLMMMPGLINLDFADVRAVMSEMGKAMMGTGEASGERRAQEAADAAISNPLLDNVSMKGAKGVLINITGGADMTLFEVDEAANRIREEVDPGANIIFGSTFSEAMEGRIRVSVVATGIDSHIIAERIAADKNRQDAVSGYGNDNDEDLADDIIEESYEEAEGDFEDALDNQSEEDDEYVEAVKNLNDEYEEARNNKKQSVSSVIREDLFVAPQAIDPEYYSDGGDGDDEDDDNGSSGNVRKKSGLFSRVAKVFGNDSDLSGYVGRAESSVKNKVGYEEKEDDKTLDIPAFLRRK